MSEIDANPFPRGALIGAAALLSFAVVGTAAVRIARVTAPASMSMSQPAALSSVDLTFSDEKDGSVIVREKGTGRLVSTLAPGTNGFVRDVMRGLAHERISHGLGAGPPFNISLFDHGRLVLEDTATGRRIDLDAFGPTNRDAFLQFLPGQRATS
jgi:putative photosynthetic complex assembly protein